MRKNKWGQPPKIEKKKKVIYYRDVENLSFREIAKEMNISKSLAHYHYHTGKKKLST